MMCIHVCSRSTSLSIIFRRLVSVDASYCFNSSCNNSWLCQNFVVALLACFQLQSIGFLPPVRFQSRRPRVQLSSTNQTLNHRSACVSGINNRIDSGRTRETHLPGAIHVMFIFDSIDQCTRSTVLTVSLITCRCLLFTFMCCSLSGALDTSWFLRQYCTLHCVCVLCIVNVLEERSNLCRKGNRN